MGQGDTPPSQLRLIYISAPLHWPIMVTGHRWEDLASIMFQASWLVAATLGLAAWLIDLSIHCHCNHKGLCRDCLHYVWVVVLVLFIQYLLCCAYFACIALKLFIVFGFYWSDGNQTVLRRWGKELLMVYWMGGSTPSLNALAFIPTVSTWPPVGLLEPEPLPPTCSVTTWFHMLNE